jgi:hypothetical protein
LEIDVDKTGFLIGAEEIGIEEIDTWAGFITGMGEG